MLRSILSICVLTLLVACGDRTLSNVTPEARQLGTLETIFTVTNRGQDGQLNFNQTRSGETSYLRARVSVPPEREAGELPHRARNADPSKHFVIADQLDLGGKEGLQANLRQALAQRPAQERDITLFVHGYNTSHPEALYRLAQMDHDMGSPGVSVLFSWPSAAKIAGYAYDHDSMTFSRDALQDTIRSLSQIAPGRTLVVAHSMGAMLVMEALRQIEIGRPGWSAKHLSGVALISPDIDVDVFKTQLDRFQALPQPFVVFVSKKDVVLELSGLINGRVKRLGRENDIEELASYPILVIDISEFADGTNGNHFTVGTSAELMAYLTSDELRQSVESHAFGDGSVTVSGQLISRSSRQARNAVEWILFPADQANASR